MRIRFSAKGATSVLMAATSPVRAGRMRNVSLAGSVTASILRASLSRHFHPGSSDAQFVRDGNVLVEQVPRQEVLHDAVPDLGVLRLQDPVVLVREVQEAVVGFAVG